MSYAIMAPSKSAVPAVTLLKNNFGLTKAQFDKYVVRLHQGDETILSCIAENHFDYCINYLTFKYSIPEENAYDICIDTMLKFRNKLLENKITYGNISYLYTRMAINIYLDTNKRKAKIECAINCFSDSDTKYKDNENLFYEILDESVRDLDGDNLTLLNEIYYSDKDIHLVAKENNISYATLRKRKQRMIEKLKNIFVQKLNK